jgi:hypothetical protein
MVLQEFKDMKIKKNYKALSLHSICLQVKYRKRGKKRGICKVNMQDAMEYET